MTAAQVSVQIVRARSIARSDATAWLQFENAPAADAYIVTMPRATVGLIADTVAWARSRVMEMLRM